MKTISALVKEMPAVLQIVLALSSFAKGAVVPADPSQNISWPYQTFKTVNFNPPELNISHHYDPSEGYLFFAPDGATEVQLGPLIMDMNGELVWNGPQQHAYNFGVQTYKGENVLTLWNGTAFPDPFGRGYGSFLIFDNNYEKIHSVTLAGNYQTLEPGVQFPSNVDFHESLITGNGSIIVTANNITQADLTSVGGPADGWVVACLVHEIDIATNQVLFTWNAVDHLDELPFTDSLYPIGSAGFNGQNQSLAWGYFHLNSVDSYDGGYLISSRFLCTAIAIDATGHIKWRLSGRHGGDFTLVGSNETTGFCYQHDIRAMEERASGVTLTMHDNHNSELENGTVPTTGKVLDVDFESKLVTLQHRILNTSGPTYSIAEGSYQPLAKGNVFLSHGLIPVLEEFSASGDILTTIQYGATPPRPGGGFLSSHLPTMSYRAYKQHWIGCPKTQPDVFVESSGAGATVYVSWNGATEVQAWKIFAGQVDTRLELVATVPKKGFETKAEIKKAKYVRVEPVMKEGCRCKDLRAAHWPFRDA